MAKILIVEDEPDLRETLVEELNDEGHLTMEAGNGLEGLEQLAADAPDMIISDITMPEMNGYQFFRSVKEKFPEHEFTPFLFLSALSGRDDQLKGLRLGVDDYLTKPVDFDLLMAKVDLNLRRQRPQPQQADAADTASLDEAPAESDGKELTALEKLALIVRDNVGQVLAGKIESVPAELLKDKFGTGWEEKAEQLQGLVAATLRSHLGPLDALCRVPPRGILIGFADLAEDQIDAKLCTIKDAIWDAVFGQWNDEDAAHVIARSEKVMLGQDRQIEDMSAFSDIDKHFRKGKDAAREACRTGLLENYRDKNLLAIKVLTPTAAPSKIKMLNFDRATLIDNRRFLNEGHFDRDFLIELYECLFQRLKDEKVFRDAFAKGAMLLPVRFDLVADDAARARMTALCQDLKDSLGATIIVELVETPDRFNTRLNALKPLPIGGNVHFVELRRLEQLGSLELGQLKELGVAFFTMRFQHVLQQEPAVLRHLIQALESNGVKFCIKDIPEGKLGEAQPYGAHLYSMH